MIDADSLIAKYGAKRKTGPGCSIGLHPQRQLIEALLAKGVQYQKTVDILVAEFGEAAKVLPESLSRHHKGRCACQKG